LAALLGEPGSGNAGGRKLFKKHVAALAASLSDVLAFWLAVDAFAKLDPAADPPGRSRARSPGRGEGGGGGRSG
jgi:hypothetical protein